MGNRVASDVRRLRTACSGRRRTAFAIADHRGRRAGAKRVATIGGARRDRRRLEPGHGRAGCGSPARPDLWGGAGQPRLVCPYPDSPKRVGDASGWGSQAGAFTAGTGLGGHAWLRRRDFAGRSLEFQPRGSPTRSRPSELRRSSPRFRLRRPRPAAAGAAAGPSRHPGTCRSGSSRPSHRRASR